MADDNFHEAIELCPRAVGAVVMASVLFVNQVAYSTSKQSLVSIVQFQLDADRLAHGEHISNAPVRVVVLLNAFELTLDLKSVGVGLGH